LPFLPTIKARDSIAEGYESGLRRKSPQIGTLIKAIVDNDERVMLPTPAVSHVRNHDEDLGDYMQRRQDYLDGKTKGMPGASLGVAVRLTAEGVDWKQSSLMPTPTARDFKDGQAEHERNGVVQTDTVARAIFNSGEVLIGTPRTSSANGSTSKQVANGAKKSRIEDQVLLTDWGKFAPAIKRWESAIGRPAPAPTKPDGKDGQQRLSSEFTEWMMGLPVGWVTNPELGLTRNEMLKMCGNGVVPQQAALALTRLLTGIDLNKEEQK